MNPTLTDAETPAPPSRLGGQPTRRGVLRTAGIVALSGGAALTLAACGAEGQAGDAVPTSAAPTSAPSSSAVSPSASSSASASESPSEAAPGKAPSGPSVDTADVPVGGGVILDDADFVVTQPTRCTYKAFSKICTHQGCPVTEVSSAGIACKCHGSVFSLKDGSVVNPPASKPLAESATTVSGAKVYVTG